MAQTSGYPDVPGTETAGQGAVLPFPGSGYGDYFAGQQLASGETVIPRINVATGATLAASGTVYLSYWTATKTETCNNIVTVTASIAAGATPTYCAMGVYSAASNGNLTLAAQCANDTTLWASTFSTYTRALTSAFSKVAGQRYAFGVMIVTGAALPNLYGYNGTLVMTATAPRTGAALAGQSSLPASITAGSLSNFGNMYFGAVTP